MQWMGGGGLGDIGRLEIINGRRKQLKISTCLNKNRIYSLLSVGKYNKFKKTLKSMNKQNGKQENEINF